MKFNLLKIALLSIAAVATVGCQNSSGSKTKKINYIDDPAVRLSLNYEGRSFFTDGIAQVTLKSPIDGDTAHFYGMNAISRPIKARFWGIDTPESTGRIQEYGMAASRFTKEKLKEANENGTIVVSTAQDTYGAPKADSTGDRYVSLIWVNLTVKNAPLDQLVLLNLWIVQEGLSYVKNVSDIPDYQPIFIAAEKQAKKLKLNLFSGKPDPEFPTGEFQPTSLLDLKHETEMRMEGIEPETSYNNAKVKINGTVAGLSDGTMYLQNFYTVEEGGSGLSYNPYLKEYGEYAGINIYCGKSSIPSKYTAIGTYLELCVIAKYSDEFGFQLTGAEGHFPSSDYLWVEGDAVVILSAEDNTEEYQLVTLEYTAAEMDAMLTSQVINEKYESFYCSNKITEALKCTSFYKNQYNDEITLTFGDHKFQAHLTSMYKGNPDKPQQVWDTAEHYVGKSFYMTGVLSCFTGGSKPRFQFIFSRPSEQLHCTDYWDADGNRIYPNV